MSTLLSYFLLLGISFALASVLFLGFKVIRLI